MTDPRLPRGVLGRLGVVVAIGASLSFLAIMRPGAFAQDRPMMHVPESPFCLSTAEATKQTHDFLSAIPTAKLTILNGDDARAWTKAFNELPPASDFKADEVWFLANEPDDSIVAFFDDGKTCENRAIPQMMIDAVTEHALGRGL